MIDFKKYLKELQSEPIENITEHSKRSSLEMLLKQFADTCEIDKHKIRILHEPKRKVDYGSPDFKIYTDNSIIGYVENKKITENLDKIIKTDQIKKYRELSKNLLITNYIEFIWIKGDSIQRETLCYLSDLENKKFKPDDDIVQKVEKLLNFFFSQPPEQIGNPKELAIALAVRCKNLKDFLFEELKLQETENIRGRLFGLYDTFKNNVFHELALTEFSDAFAQMLVYGLFLARLNADTKTISLNNAKEYIPGSFQLIKELVGFLDELDNPEYKETRWIIDETISIMNNINLSELTRQLTFSRRIKNDENIETDPYIYFYETFLSKYDSKLRKAKGVYYTPPQIVNFIIRAINDILKDVFNIKDGFADHNSVTVLDFATGTGTFLVEIFRQIFDTLPPNSKAKKDLLVKEHILKNIYGFEYLIAPYTIAHLKLSQFLKENGYELTDDERLQIYLTNTLEPVHAQINLYVPQLSREGEQAQKVKDKPILVITGNPPYSYVSKNNGPWICDKIKDYYKVDGEPLKERNSKGLQDDYVKFIRFAQDKMEQVEQGVIGIITNHSFLDNPTYKGMRQSLLNTFNQLYFIDLHGNSDKQEVTPDGKKDKNVFDIKTGVCISIFVKQKVINKIVKHVDFWGLREQKYENCLNSSLVNLDWHILKPVAPFYLFKSQNYKLMKQYEQFKLIKEIFQLSNECIKTNRDHFLVGFSKLDLKNRINDLLCTDISDIEINRKYNLDEGKYWNTNREREKVKKDNEIFYKICNYAYRPFDNRFVLYKPTLIEIGRGGASKKVMENMLHNNLGLVFTRFAFKKNLNYSYNIVTNYITDVNFIQSPGSAQLAPLYLINKTESLFGAKSKNIIDKKIENFTTSFQEFINNKYSSLNYTPEQIFSYIYAILYCSTFRNKYAEFLKMDFPRIPFCESAKQFERISKLGWELIQKHLLNEIPAGSEYKNMGIYKGDGDNIVIKPEHKIIKSGNGYKNMLYINKTQFFDNVPENVYKFYIGGYQVLDKYLKDRKNRTLTIDEIENVEKVVKVLAFTIKQMELIDKETREWI